MVTLAVQNLTFRYPGAAAAALTGINLEIASGEFVLLTGPTGCGKTTLLHHFQPQLLPVGEVEGRVLYRGQALIRDGGANLAGEIGLVAQDPSAQLTMDTVRRELVFGMENMQVPPADMHRRLGEMASFFGLTSWLDRPLHQLSGGQQQIVNLAAAMLLRPRVLLLDEPTAQLDPVTAKEFLHLLGRIHTELGVTIVMSEHRLEDVFPLCTQAVFMRAGRIEAVGTAPALCHRLWGGGDGPHRAWVPSLAKVALACQDGGGQVDSGGGGVRVTSAGANLPLTVRQGKRWLRENKTLFSDRPLPSPSHSAQFPGAGRQERASAPALHVQNLSFRYNRWGPPILADAQLAVPPNQVFALLGANGAGKSTLLKLMLGLLLPQSGRVLVDGREVWRIPPAHRVRLLGYLDQNPGLYFAADTVGEALRQRSEQLGHRLDHALDSVLAQVGLDPACLARHPYDLSGGELQLAALALILLADPVVLLLDEPTKGLDPAAKERLGRLLRRLAREKTVVMASHDVEFAAAFAHQCALLFDGQVLPPAAPRRFFSENYFYTTAVSRVFRPVRPEAVTWRDVVPW